MLILAFLAALLLLRFIRLVLLMEDQAVDIAMTLLGAAVVRLLRPLLER